MRRALLLLLVLLAGCGESMDRQNRMKAYGDSKPPGWPAAGEALSLPPGTVSRDALAEASALAQPPPVTPALLARGRQRYDIYCAACHGLTGGGDGIVVARGFPRPPSFSAPAQMQLAARQIVDVIGQGHGKMYGFYDRVGPADRWAITAYLRALQLAAKGRR